MADTGEEGAQLPQLLKDWVKSGFLAPRRVSSLPTQPQLPYSCPERQRKVPSVQVDEPRAAPWVRRVSRDVRWALLSPASAIWHVDSGTKPAKEKKKGK